MKKINLFIVSGISAIILFGLLTFLEGQFINKEPVKTVFIVNTNIKKDEKILAEYIKEVEVPLSLVIDTEVITSKEELKDKYAVSDIYKGEILFRQNLSSKEELKIVEVDNGLERISVNIKNPENAVSYQIRPKDRIHLYFTGRTAMVRDSFLKYGLSLENVQNENSVQTVKLLEDVEVLGIYDEFGRSYQSNEFNKLDTVVLGVSREKAEMINNLRDQGVFDITR